MRITCEHGRQPLDNGELDWKVIAIAANLEGLHCRVGTVGPIGLRWVSGFEVQCVATAHAGRRHAPVAVLTSISMAPAMPLSSFRGGQQARGKPAAHTAGRCTLNQVDP